MKILEKKNAMGLIERYENCEAGFQPVLTRDRWQVGKLNYEENHHLDNLKILYKHRKSDRAISLLQGSAVLIIATDHESTNFEMVQLKRGTSYNIPKGTRYAIAMNEGSQLLTVESPEIHSKDVTIYPMTEEQRESIRKQIKQETNK